MTYAEAKARFEAIVAEEKEASKRQYRYGYMVDRMREAELFREKMSLKRQFGLGVYENF